MTSTPIPVACSLDAREAQTQALEWVDLQHLALGSSVLDSGARMGFPADLASKIVNLAEREAACCAFLNITTAASGDQFVVEITSDNPDAITVIAALSGARLS